MPRTRSIIAFIGVAGIGAVPALGCAAHDTTPGRADAAPASAVKAEVNAQHAATPTPKHRTTISANGKVYHCSSSVLGEVDVAKDRMIRREKVLDERKASVRKIERRYPNGHAPAAVVARYETLRARANAQVKFTNQAIRQYNRVLQDKCA